MVKSINLFYGPTIDMFIVQWMNPIRPMMRVHAKEKLVPISLGQPKDLTPIL